MTRTKASTTPAEARQRGAAKQEKERILREQRMSRYRDVADRIALRDLAEQNEAVAIATRIANSRLAERIDPEEIRGSLADIPETIVVGPNAAPMRPIEPVREHPVCKSRGRVTSAPPKQRAQAPS